MMPTTIQLPPFSIQVDDCEATVLEVLKSTLVSGEIWYHVSVQIKYKGIKTRTFTIDVKDTQSLINKLKTEVTKMKFIEYTYGLQELKRLVSG